MYFIAIVLPEDLNEKIIRLKNIAQEKWNCKVGLKSPAHITIIPPFWMDENREQNLLQDIDSATNQLKSFSITTNNFSAFKPRTIFIDVIPNEALKNTKKEVDHFFTLKDPYKIKIDHRPFHPHITIATRDLHKKSFYETWELFKEKNFEEEFTAFGLSLLRHNKKNWDVIHTSQFK